MRRNLWAALSRVERLAAEVERRDGDVDPDQLVQILLQGRQRAARGEPCPYSQEELRAQSRRMRAMLEAERAAR